LAGFFIFHRIAARAAQSYPKSQSASGTALNLRGAKGILIIGNFAIRAMGMNSPHTIRMGSVCLARAFALVCGVTIAISSAPAQSITPAPAPQSASPQDGQSATPSTKAPGLPRGKKLVMKDGTFQLVREYQVDGDRVRYYSIEERQWEEMPEAMVDWEATKKAVADEAETDASIVKKAHVQEEGRRAQPLDIDASIEAAEGVFLPPGEGIFVFDGKAVFPMKQADVDSKISKKKAIEKVLVPIPIVPSRHVVSIQGSRANLRVKQGQTEIFMRTADGREPEMNLVRARVRGDKREIVNIDDIFKQQTASAKMLSIQRWQLAPGVYRFTISQTLEPGEYAIAEIVQNEQMSIYVWDFGIDAADGTAAQKSR
jgi:hypothetical protein